MYINSIKLFYIIIHLQIIINMNFKKIIIKVKKIIIDDKL